MTLSVREQFFAVKLEYPNDFGIETYSKTPKYYL